MRKILFFNPVASLGGAEKSLLDVMFSLKQQDPDTQIHLVTGQKGPLIEEAELIGVSSEVLTMPRVLLHWGDGPKQPLWVVLSIFKLVFLSPIIATYVVSFIKKVREIKPQIVHTNGFKSHLVGSFVRSCPVVWHLRDFVSRRRLVKWLTRWRSRHIAAVICISDAVRYDLAKVSSCGSYTVYNAIDLSEYTPTGEVAQLENWTSGLEESSLTVGMVSTFAKWKGHEIFIQAASKCIKKFPNLRFFVVGGSIYETNESQYALNELQEMALKHKVSANFVWIDFQKYTAPFYRAFDMTIHCSTQPEPFGRTIVEALACGRPVIASHDGGTKEILESFPLALTFAPSNSDELAAKILLLAENSALRSQMGGAGHQYVVEHFDRTRLAPEICEIYNKIL